MKPRGSKAGPRAAAANDGATHGMTPAAAELIIDMINVEDLLSLRGDGEGILLAAALADYRRRLEKQEGFVRPRPDPTLGCLTFIKIQKGNGWVKLIDTRVEPRRLKPRLPQ